MKQISESSVKDRKEDTKWGYGVEKKERKTRHYTVLNSTSF